MNMNINFKTLTNCLFCGNVILTDYTQTCNCLADYLINYNQNNIVFSSIKKQLIYNYAISIENEKIIFSIFKLKEIPDGRIGRWKTCEKTSVPIEIQTYFDTILNYLILL